MEVDGAEFKTSGGANGIAAPGPTAKANGGGHGSSTGSGTNVEDAPNFGEPIDIPAARQLPWLVLTFSPPLPPNPTTFHSDLEAYAARYTGYTKVQRLLFVAQHCKYVMIAVCMPACLLSCLPFPTHTIPLR